MSLRALAAKATPGPWTFVPSRSVREPAIVRASDGKTVVPYARTEECARLIALAPELAVLCDKASRWIDMVLAQGAILEGDAALGDEIVKAVLELEARP